MTIVLANDSCQPVGDIAFSVNKYGSLKYEFIIRCMACFKDDANEVYATRHRSQTLYGVNMAIVPCRFFVILTFVSEDFHVAGKVLNF